MRPSDEHLEAEYQAFAGQCAESGLLVWRSTPDATVLDAPALDTPLRRWLSSPAMQAMISEKFAFGGDEASRALELYPGCWIACALDSSAQGGTFWLTLVPTEAALVGASFESACASMGLAPGGVAAALQPFVKYTPLQKEQAVAAFVRLHSHWSAARRDRGMINEFTWKLSQAFEELNLFFRLARSLDTTADPVRIIHGVCEELQQVLPFGWVAASFASGAGRVPALEGRAIGAGTLPCVPAAVAGVIDASCAAAAAGSGSGWVRIHSPAKTPLSQLAGGQVIAEAISHDGQPIGALLAGGKSGPDAEVTSEELQLLNAAAGIIAVFHENVARFAGQKALFIGTVRSLAASIDAKDRYTRGHSERVALLATLLGRAMGLDAEALEQYRITGLLHDVGKIGTPEAILTKVTRLSDEEFREIMKHPQTGYDILKDIPGIAFALPGVLHHHEKFDGRGYPHGLAGEQIPLAARVLTLADTFDAMRSTRAYRSARPHDVAIAEIRRCAGTQFDPRLAELFVNLDFGQFEQMLVREPGPPIAA